MSGYYSVGLLNLVVGFVLIVRAGFYAENLLSYAHQAKEEGALPLPIGQQHKFAPVALGVSLPSFYLNIADNAGCCTSGCPCLSRKGLSWLG